MIATSPAMMPIKERQFDQRKGADVTRNLSKILIQKSRRSTSRYQAESERLVQPMACSPCGRRRVVIIHTGRKCRNEGLSLAHAQTPEY